MALSKIPGDEPANDNEHPDEPWLRADLILQAYSGADLNNPENQKTAITQLITDLMHYCEVMSIGAPENHPDHIDFEDLLDKAYEDYWVQADTMKAQLSPGRNAPARSSNSALPK